MLPFAGRLFACGAIVLLEWYAPDTAENEEKKDAESTLWSRKCFHLPPARGITSKTRGSEKVLSLINAFSLSQVGHFHIAIDFFQLSLKICGFQIFEYLGQWWLKYTEVQSQHMAFKQSPSSKDSYQLFDLYRRFASQFVFHSSPSS